MLQKGGESSVKGMKGTGLPAAMGISSCASLRTELTACARAL